MYKGTCAGMFDLTGSWNKFQVQFYIFVSVLFKRFVCLCV